jgi:predicted NBD/HSP70 family sugar kinase
VPPSTDEPRRPSLSVVRELTDRHVIEQLLATAELTRAELAARTHISKPTISESIRRLAEARVVEESGHQMGRRGPAGTFYRLRAGVGVALAASAGPDGVVVETLDLRGGTIDRRHTPVTVPTTRAELEPVLRDATERVVAAAPGPVLAATLSIAGPVDRATGRLVQLPDSPFLVDDLDPVPLLRPALTLDPVVDNDVDWAALAEREVGSARGLDDFVYVFLGPGLGGAVVTGGRIAHGGRGLAGEIAHLLTVGARGRSVRLIEAFVELGLRRVDSLALDLDLVRAALDGRTPADRRTRDRILEALAAAIGSIAALLDPEAVLVGGPWSDHPELVDRLPRAVAATTIVRTELRFAELGPDAPHLGARLAAVREARAVLTGQAQTAQAQTGRA